MHGIAFKAPRVNAMIRQDMSIERIIVPTFPEGGLFKIRFEVLQQIFFA